MMRRMTTTARDQHKRYTDHMFQGLCICPCPTCTKPVGDGVLCTCKDCPTERCGAKKTPAMVR